MLIGFKKYILLSLVLLFGFYAKAQLSSSAANSREDIKFGSVEKPVLSTNFYYQLISVASVKGVNPNVGATRSWWNQYVDSTGTFSKLLQVADTSSLTLAAPQDGAGYEFVSTNGIDTIHYFCWTFEPKYTLESAEVDTAKTVTNCAKIGLLAKTTTKPLFYRNPLETSKAIPVNYKLTYKWKAEPADDTTIPEVWDPKFAQPYLNTTYSVVVGNGLSLGDLSQTIAPIYTARGIRASFKVIALGKQYDNELEDDTIQSPMTASGPFKVLFLNTSLGVEYTDANIEISRNDTVRYDEPYDKTRPYTFSTEGEYSVKLKISLPSCLNTVAQSAPFVVKLSSAYLAIPNCFTPGGSGPQEFRVAYSSLKTYQIYIYNQWGRLVYESDNPGDGWDGTDSFGDAASGVYFYVITATDMNGGDLPCFKGPVTLLRNAY